MDVDTAFLETLDDLRKRSGLMATEYERLQAAGLIRRLLFDAESLLEQVNSQSHRRLKVRFAWWGEYMATPTGIFFTSYVIDPAFNAERVPGHKPTVGSLDRFQKARIAFRAPPGRVLGPPPESVNVLEVVSHYANRLGGVHFDTTPPSNDLLAEIMASSIDEIHYAMGSIARIIVRSLDPLANRIFEETYFHRLRLRRAGGESVSEVGDTPSA
jgi:hypothetical protein